MLSGLLPGGSARTAGATDTRPAPTRNCMLNDAQSPDRPDETLYVPIVQICEKGESRWIEIPAAGQKSDDLKEPAPAIRLTPKAK